MGGPLFADGDMADRFDAENPGPVVVTDFQILIGRDPLRARWTAVIFGEVVTGYLVERRGVCSLFVLVGDSPEADRAAHADTTLLDALIAADEDERINIDQDRENERADEAEDNDG